MDEARSSRWPRVALAAIAGLAALAVLAALFDVWPFDDGGQLTAEEFIAQGDDICSDAHQQFADLQPSPPSTAEEAAVLTGKLLSISEDEYNAILDLREPDELEVEVTRYLQARSDGIDLIRDAYDAAQNDDARAYYRSLKKVSSTQVERLKLARDVGFSECSRPLPALAAASQ